MEKAPGQLEIVLGYFTEFSPAEIAQLKALGPLYEEWNSRINLISRKDIDSLYEKHILHSLSIAAVFDFRPGMEVIDIGTGGGFPGIPLAIFFPQAKFHLIDSIGKKLKAVDAIAAAIGLENVTTRHSRAGDIKDRKFDVAVSRAVAPLKELWTWSRPLLRKSPGAAGLHGMAGAATLPGAPAPNPVPSGLICLKGGDLAAEISGSGLRPKMIELDQVFDRAYFHQKYLLQVPY
ncbi:MAG TPA: 16S rRNA (guanine(527)-N(7))-methyltransferase RsmG [Puia sp.]|nr:16S rRNA (guanine(527)-N(7))-methyltransferase RsmG [Puia sp.]